MVPISAIDRLPVGKRNAAMEKISRNALRLRSKKVTGAPFGRENALEQLVTRLGVIPVFLWPLALPVAGQGNVHALAPPGGGTVTLTYTDGSTPATDSFAKGTPSTGHTFTAPGLQTITATFSGSANAKGRASASA